MRGQSTRKFERNRGAAIDVGIDRGSLCPYVIEVNTFPGTRFHAWQLAEKRVQYFKYLLQTGKSSR